jgi:cytochrome c peroxidase
MHGPPEGASERNVADLAAYLETLPPPPGLGAARGEAPSVRGAKLFKELNCAACHAGPRFTSAATYDVGVHDPHGETRFNPPSLLGVSQRGPFFHDGRPRTLREVFERHHHGDTNGLTSYDLDALVVYLNSL